MENNRAQYTKAHFKLVINLLIRQAGYIPFSNLKGDRKVKIQGNNLNWTKIPLGGEEVHILNVNLDPGLESFVGKRAETVINLDLILFNDIDRTEAQLYTSIKNLPIVVSNRALINVTYGLRYDREFEDPMALRANQQSKRQTLLNPNRIILKLRPNPYNGQERRDSNI